MQDVALGEVGVTDVFCAEPFVVRLLVLRDAGDELLSSGVAASVCDRWPRRAGELRSGVALIGVALLTEKTG